MFCKYCGKELPEGGRCSCPGAEAARKRESRQEKPAEPSQTAERAKAVADHVGRHVGAAFRSVPGEIRGLMADFSGTPLKLPAAIIFCCAELICYILGYVCLNQGMWSYLASLGGQSSQVGAQAAGQFTGTVIGIGSLHFLLTVCVTMLIPVLFQLLRKEKISLLSAFSMAAGITAVPSVLFLLSGLLMLVVYPLGLLVAVAAFLTHMLMYAKVIWKNVRDTRSVVTMVLTGLILAVIVFLIGWILWSVMYNAIAAAAAGAMGYSSYPGFYG